MLALIVLILIARSIGKLAFDKGRNRYLYWLYTVLVWFGSQFLLGAILAMIYPEIMYDNNDTGIRIVGILGSVVSVGVFYWIVYNMPDQSIGDEGLIDQIGMEEPDYGETRSDQ